MTDEQIERLEVMISEGRRMAWQDGDRFREIEKVGQRCESFETAVARTRFHMTPGFTGLTRKVDDDRTKS